MQQLSRYLAMDGMTGECPEDYAVFQAAKYLGCTPWELLNQSVWWQMRALQFMSAENKARKILEDRNKS